MGRAYHWGRPEEYGAEGSRADALTGPERPCHVPAPRRFAEGHDQRSAADRSRGRGSRGWATCPFTQARFVRIVSNSAFSRDAVQPRDATQVLGANTAAKDHALWADDRAFADAVTFAGVRLIGHQQVTEARDRGLPAFAETCPQYLFLSEDNYDEPDFGGSKYVMSPPLRARSTQDKLWRGLAFNDLQAIATDHCPFCMKEKHLGDGDFSKIPNGAPGVETRMSLVYDGGVRTGRISINRFVELTSTSPAKIFGMFPKKGTIAPGSDADIVIFDPNKTTTLSAKTHHMKVDYNPTKDGRSRA